MSMFETGVAVRSGAAIDPMLHLVVRDPEDWKTWCGGGPAIKGFVTITGRRCPKCSALAKSDIAENGEPDEQDEMSWFLNLPIPTLNDGGM